MLSSLFSKKKYQLPNDFKNMTIEEIIKTDPKDIKNNIIDKEEIRNLSSNQREALRKLVAIKKIEKELKVTEEKKKEIRNNYINKYLSEKASVINLLVKSNTEVDKEDLFTKNTENRLNKIRGLPTIPYTEEEEIIIRNEELKKKGGKKSKANKKNKRSKTRKIRKTKQ
jgi:hypothetical protein